MGRRDRISTSSLGWPRHPQRPARGDGADRTHDTGLPIGVQIIDGFLDDAEPNRLRRADELTADGDHSGAAIWHRITVAIERLTDTTGPLN